MARKSILTPALQSPCVAGEPPAVLPAKPGRVGKRHIGGYFDPQDTTISAFQKLGIDLDKTQQQMLEEALEDYVEKHRAATAFKANA